MIAYIDVTLHCVGDLAALEVVGRLGIETWRLTVILQSPDSGDVILVAGKGHEDYQIIKGVKHHFDDHEIVRKYANI